jgi:chemotaxis protein methyltransferase CheR
MVTPVVKRVPERDGYLDAKSLEKLKDFVLQKIGFSLSKNKIKELKTFTSELMALSSCENFDQFHALLYSSSPEADLVLNRLTSFLTTGETYFFRIESHFRVIKEVLIPEIVKRHRNDRKIRIWSAGCSTGEEPYSLAIMLAESLPELADWEISILATDINREALNKTQEGLYGRWSFRGVPMDVIKRNFTHKGDKYLIKKKFKDMITFKYLNLVEDGYPSLATNTAEIDLILCRNVSIYFSPEVITRVVSKLYKSLVEGGYLLVGPAECSADVYRNFVTRVFPDVIVYQKRAQKQPLQIPTITTAPLLPLIQLRKESQVAVRSLPAPARPDQQPKESYPEQRGGVEKKETRIFGEAIQLFEKGEYSHSIEKFMEVLKINPDNSRAYFLLGRISTQQGDIADAIHCLGKSLEKDPLLLEAYYLLALLRLEDDNVQEAVTLLKKAIYINQKFVLAYYHLGIIYKKQGKTALAIKMFANVKELLTGCNPHDNIIEGEDISVGQILSVAEKGLAVLEGKPA